LQQETRTKDQLTLETLTLKSRIGNVTAENENTKQQLGQSRLAAIRRETEKQAAEADHNVSK